MHAEVVGSTGTGKSESVLLPLLAHDIKSGRGAIVIDGKGDLELLDRIHFVVKKTGRLSDFYFFSLAHPKKSHTYNPLLRGNATELKDKIIILNEHFIAFPNEARPLVEKILKKTGFVTKIIHP